MADIDQNLSRLNIPKDALRELQALVDKPISNTTPPQVGSRSRFNATLISTVTLGILNSVIVQLSLQDSVSIGYFSLLIGFLSMEWFNLHGGGLTRRRKAFLNVRNVLDTYKVNDRESGHLFQPEPDTPKPEMSCCGPPPPPGESPMNLVGRQIIQEKANIGSSTDPGFDKAVQDHYGGMYNEIKRMNAELAVLSSNNQRLDPATLDYGTNQQLVAADVTTETNKKAGSKKTKK